MINWNIWVGILAGLAMILVMVIGRLTAPSVPESRRTAQAQNTLPSIVPFTPPSDFVGEHKYGMWTLYCRKDEAGAESGVAASAPVSPDLGADIAATGAKRPRCLTHARMQVRTAQSKPRVMAVFNVAVVGPEQKPFLVLQLPGRANGEKFALFAIDKNPAFKATFETCNEAQCMIQSAMPPQAAAQMTAGEQLLVRFFLSGSKQKIDIAYPLHGFKESYEALKLAQAGG